jgi:hypothetical protein
VFPSFKSVSRYAGGTKQGNVPMIRGARLLILLEIVDQLAIHNHKLGYIKPNEIFMLLEKTEHNHLHVLAGGLQGWVLLKKDMEIEEATKECRDVYYA